MENQENKQKKSSILSAKNLTIVGLGIWVYILLHRKPIDFNCPTVECPKCPTTDNPESICEVMPYKKVLELYQGKVIRDCKGYIFMVHKSNFLLIGNTEPAQRLKRLPIYENMFYVNFDIWENACITNPDNIGHLDLSNQP